MRKYYYHIPYILASIKNISFDNPSARFWIKKDNSTFLKEIKKQYGLIGLMLYFIIKPKSFAKELWITE